MKRYLWTSTIFIVLGLYGVTLMSCMTKNQLLAEQSYYEAKVKIAAAKTSSPIFRMVPIEAGKPIIITNGTVEVFAQSQNSDANFAQFAHRDFTPSWIPSLLNAAAPLGILYGGSLLIKSMPNSGGNITDSYNTRTTSTSNTATTSTFSNTASGGSVANMGSGQANLITTYSESPVIPPVVVPPVVIVP
jgi:hypothetical protein